MEYGLIISMSNLKKYMILVVLGVSVFVLYPPTVVTLSFAQNNERVVISVSNSSFVPLTNTDANQVRVGVEYTIEDESIENEKINAVMKMYAPNGSLIRTTSIPSGFTPQRDGGIEELVRLHGALEVLSVMNALRCLRHGEAALEFVRCILRLNEDGKSAEQ